MALKVQSSFSAGELDPALHERTTLQKFKTGLSTARNVVVSKQGTIISRPARTHMFDTLSSTYTSRFYAPYRTEFLVEMTHLEGRIRAPFTSNNSNFFTHSFTSDDLENLKFEYSNPYVYVFCQGKATIKLDLSVPLGTFAPVIVLAPFTHNEAPTNGTVTASGAPTGYYVDYLITKIKNGQESGVLVIPGASTYRLPIAAGQSNDVTVRVVTGTTNDGCTGINVYRRPQNGGAFGFIGSSSYVAASGGNLISTFTDTGVEADYSHTPPQTVAVPPDIVSLTEYNWESAVGTVYQQRMILNSSDNVELLLASRVGYLNNFYRDFPLAADGALAFKHGSSGFAGIYDLLDADGLVVFTTAGVFRHRGQLSPDNLSLEKKGKWVIDYRVRPLAVPGGLFFVDVMTNTIRNLLWSEEVNVYNGQEVTIFSNHLFQTRRVTSMAYHEGAIPLLWVTFDDGTYASFTYEYEQEMRAWTRHDSQVAVEAVIETGIADRTYFLVKRLSDNKRFVEVTVPRFIPASTYQDDPDADKNASIAFMDSMLSYGNLLNNSLVGADQFVLTPVTPGDWEGELELTSGTSAIFTSGGAGAVGEVFRIFDSESPDFPVYSLEVTQRDSDFRVRVQPDIEFNSNLYTGFQLWRTANVFTGLSHLEGEYPAVIVDGAVVCSPYNDGEDYPAVQVSGGSLTLPGTLRGAIVHIGRSITADVGTLDIDTVEQAPTLVESLTVNKLMLKLHRSVGLFVSHSFPEGNSIASMIPIHVYRVDYSEPSALVGNTYKLGSTDRYELSLPGDWASQGKIALRQVDPRHFEISSIIPDLDILRRGR